MKVQIDIGLDFDGIHNFDWKASDTVGAVELARSTLDRWTTEREAFTLAYLRWKRVIEEVEDVLYRAEHQRATSAESDADSKEPTVRQSA